MCSGSSMLSSAGLTESETVWTEAGHNSFLHFSSCFLVSGEEKQRGAKRSPQLLPMKGGIESLSIACRLGSSCQNE